MFHDKWLIALLFVGVLAPSVLADGVAVPGMTVIAKPGDVQVIGYQFDPDTAKQGAWHGQWITVGGASAPVLLRKAFELPAAPTRVRAWISANPASRLYINGTLVSRDPDDIGHDYNGGWTHHWFYECRDLTPFFHAGANVVAAETLTGVPMMSQGPPALLFEATVTFPAGSPITLATDANWKAIEAPQYRSIERGGKGAHINVLDSTREPTGWRENGFDDSKWPAAVIDHTDRGMLTPSQIPPRMEAIYPSPSFDRVSDGVTLPTTPGDPIRITKDASFAVRYDRNISGYFGLHARGAAGTLITLQGSETRALGGSNRFGGLVLGNGETYYESPWLDSFSTMNITVSNVTGPVEIDDLRAIFISQPVTYRGDFECSDPALTNLWKSLRWSLQMCMQAHHLDSPNHYEPISDPGDYLIESVANDYTFNSPWLIKQDLRKYAWMIDGKHYRPFHTCYALLWLQMLSEYYRYTGDAQLVKQLAPYVHKLLAEFASYRGANGLLSNAPDFMFMDWVVVDGFQLHHPPAVIGQGYMTAFFYRALEDGMLVSKVTGDTEHEKIYGQMRQEIAAAYERELWNADKGLYRDGRPGQSATHPGPDAKWKSKAEQDRWLPADKDIETFTPQNNFLAVLYGLAPPDRAAGIVDKLFADGPDKVNMRPYFWYFALPALERAGLFQKYALPLMSLMHINPQTQTAQEMLNAGDWSHAWIAAPLINLSSTVLGVSPGSPGYGQVDIKPLTCGLSWAKGTVPTVWGDVIVSWKQSAGSFSIDVTIPNDSHGILTPPPQCQSHEKLELTAGTHHFDLPMGG
jgi:hypothetical protein